MEAKKDLPSGIVKAQTRIAALYDGNDTLKSTDEELNGISRNLSKMYGRTEEEWCQTATDHLFTLALERMQNDHDKEVLKNLRKMVREAETSLYKPHSKFQDAFFFPNMENIQKVKKYISMARKTLELCIFSFTNDVLADEILAAHQRGVVVRIISDDEAMKGKGADTQRMADAGIECRTDSEEQYHMHNKFMIVDQTFLLTGSFNWTFQAGKSNQENVVILDGKYYLQKYCAEFNKLWSQFSKNEVEKN